MLMDNRMTTVVQPASNGEKRNFSGIKLRLKWALADICSHTFRPPLPETCCSDFDVLSSATPLWNVRTH